MNLEKLNPWNWFKHEDIPALMYPLNVAQMSAL